MTDIPEWAKPLVAARERGATLQGLSVNDEWRDESEFSTPGKWNFNFSGDESWYRIKPGTDPGEHTADPLIFGASTPGNEPVPVRDEYVPLTDAEADGLWWAASGLNARNTARCIHRAGWEHRRTT